MVELLSWRKTIHEGALFLTLPSRTVRDSSKLLLLLELQTFMNMVAYAKGQSRYDVPQEAQMWLTAAAVLASREAKLIKCWQMLLNSIH